MLHTLVEICAKVNVNLGSIAKSLASSLACAEEEHGESFNKTNTKMGRAGSGTLN